MPDAVRAVGLGISHEDLWETLTRLEGQVSANHTETMREVAAIKKTLGCPAESDLLPPTGVFFELAKLDKRLRPFELGRERIMGAFMVGGPLLTACGAIIWFLGHTKIEHLFHG